MNQNKTSNKVFNSPTQNDGTAKAVPKTLDMLKTQKTTVTDMNESQGSECLFDKSETESAFGTAPTSPKKDTPLVEAIIPDESEIPNMDECKQSTRLDDQETDVNMEECKQSTKIADEQKPIKIDNTERISEDDELE